MIYSLSMMLPSPQFIHSGFELCEQNPVNTGLGFTREQIELYPAESLPLFSNIEMDWQSGQNIIRDIKSINDYFGKHSELISPHDELFLLDSPSEVVAFLRRTKNTQMNLLFIANFNPNLSQSCVISNMEENTCLESHSGKMYNVENGNLNFSLNPFEYIFGFLVKSIL